MEKFEGTYVGYMLNTGGMPFFMVASYPHYTFVDGRLVEDTSVESEDLKTRAREYRALMRKVESRVHRNMAVPKSWVRKLEGAETLVMALQELRVVATEWAENFYKTLRFLKVYEV